MIRFNKKEYPRCSAVGNSRPYFKKAISKGLTFWRTDRPVVFYIGDISTDLDSVLFGQ